jgi:hypothetical protein
MSYEHRLPEQPSKSGEREMRSTGWALALAAVLGLAGAATAGEKGKKGGQGAKATGTLVSAALEGEQVTWTVDVEAEEGVEAGQKTFEMPASVVVMCAEKNGQKRVRGIRAVGKKEIKAKGNMTVVKGTFVKLEVQGRKATLTITADDGEQTLDMGAHVTVMFRERRGKTTAMGIVAARGKGGAGKKGEGKGKKKGGAPDNL